MSKLMRAVTKDGEARILIINSTDIVEKARIIHSLTPTSSAVLGRSLSAASLMSCLLKDKENTLTLQINGDGPAGRIVCVGDYKGNVKGYMINPGVELPLRADEKLDVGGAVGKGTMYVIKDMGFGEPYIGMSELVSGEIAEDITSYFATSEQTPSVCALGVLVDRDKSIKAAGGFIIQLLPGADDSSAELIEKNITALPPVTQLISEGKTNLDIAKEALSGIDFDVFDEYEVGYVCGCSKERYAEALSSIGIDELKAMLEENHPQTASCYFCGASYTFSPQEIGSILSAAELKLQESEKEKTKQKENTENNNAD